ncbi:hypothetical protein WJU23_23180 [Prosthecobacter sp. SYSU 5D2]|uniref:hypothetical protein n=1 Tax=Prosthecobacter sp. SYSU 5D2 TaxID=3134134 RepID=UPI0031FEB4F9
MNFPQKYLTCTLLALLAGLSALPAAEEPKGRWTPPTTDARPWKHGPTQLAFPPMLGGYRFVGHFDYEDNGVLLRYENLDEQGRLDLFLFKSESSLSTVADIQARLMTEMDIVVRDMETMIKNGRYKNLNTGELVGGELDLWQKQSLPIATRIITATRIGYSDAGSEEAVVRQWVGITALEDHIITIRHMRPAATGDAGEESMKQVVGLVFQLLKDPSLRTHIRELVDDYLKDPFSENGEQAAAAVLAYLKQTPYFPINIPEDPVSGWLDHVKKVAPGTEEHLLRAFMLGSAKVAFAEGDTESCFKAGARQFAKIYRQLLADHPQITRPEIEQFVTAAEAGQALDWMKAYELRK